MTLGERLRDARTYLDLTQTEVSKKTGINNKTLSNWENNVSKPSPDDLLVLSEIYDISLDELLKGKTIGQLASEYKPRTLTEAESKQEALNRVMSRDRATSPPSGLSPKEERDIESDLEDMMNSMASAAYEGDTEADEDVEALKATLKAAMMQAKKIAKKKYTPKKYRRD